MPGPFEQTHVSVRRSAWYRGPSWGCWVRRTSPKAVGADHALRWSQHCASTSCSSGEACRTHRWKTRCTTCRCSVTSLGGWLGQPAGRREHHPEIPPPAGEHKLAPQILQTVNDLLSAKGLLLKSAMMVDATLIAAPSSTKNASGERDPEIKHSKKGNRWYFSMKCHIGFGRLLGLSAHSAGHSWQRQRRGGSQQSAAWPVARRLGRSRLPGPAQAAQCQGLGELERGDAPGPAQCTGHARPESAPKQIERIKAHIQAKVEHPFRVVKR